MWSALENMALRESLPLPLETGRSIHDILIAGQLAQDKYTIHHLGRRRLKPYLLKQFYCLDTNGFLRWQNEARFTQLPRTPGYIWPSEEWRGGLISPHSEGVTLHEWVDDSPSLPARIRMIAILAERILRLHRSGITHRNISPAAIQIDGSSVVVTNFGLAASDQLDDLWTDSHVLPDVPHFTPPEAYHRLEDGRAADTFAFGAIAHFILSGRPPFGQVRQVLRSLFPTQVLPSRLNIEDNIPDILRALIGECMNPNPTYRPTMENVASVMGPIATFDYSDNEKVRFPTPSDQAADRRKIMVFIKDDERAVTLFDTALEQAVKEPSLFMFVGLIPANLPSGYMERFKGRLFKKLSQGLLRCRQADLLWSLRVFDQTIPEKAAVEMIRQYTPDEIYLGKTTGHRIAFQKDFRQEVSTENVRIRAVS